jgi:hypothetical protein
MMERIIWKTNENVLSGGEKSKCLKGGNTMLGENAMFVRHFDLTNC